MKRRNGSSGFTLIELLVVIAIIAVLAAILFPVLGTAQEAGRRGTCASNVKQVYGAVMMYVDDNSGTLPVNYDYNSFGSNGMRTFLNSVNKYLRNWKVVSCPTKPTVECPRWDGRSGYVMLCEVFNYHPAAPEVPQTPYSMIARPTRTVLLMDTLVFPPLTWGAWQTYPWGTVDFRGYPAWVARMLNGKDSDPAWRSLAKNFCRHSGGMNCCFADGHVKYYRSGEFTSSMFTKDARDEPWKGARW